MAPDGAIRPRPVARLAGQTQARPALRRLGITSRVQLTRLVILNSELADLDTSGVA